MIHPEYFGNPNNPFDEAIPHPEYLLFGSSVRNLVSKQILYMMECQDRIERTTESEGVTTRRVQLEATAPLHQEGVFLNSAKTDFDQEEGDVTWETVLLDLEDTVLGSDNISERRIVLKRPAGLTFGVAGIDINSRTVRGLSSLTVKLMSIPDPHAELWALINGKDRFIMDATAPHMEAMDSHLIALSRTLGRNLKKLIEKPGEKAKYKFSDFKD